MANFRAKLPIVITAAIMLFIFVHSAMPGEMSGAESSFVVRILAAITGLAAEPIHFIVRKAAHFIEFLALGCSLTVNAQAYLRRRPSASSSCKGWMIPWIAGTLYAVTDELHQLFVPGRACAPADICIDSAGVAAGVVIMILLRRAVR